MVCSFSAEDFFSLTNSALDKAINYFFQTWLQNDNYAMVDNYLIEYYDARCIKNNPENEEGYDALYDSPPEMDIMVRIAVIE